MRNVLDKSTHFMYNNFFFRKSSRLWDNVDKYDGARGVTNDVTIWRIRVVCWISKATRTHARAYTQMCNICCFSTPTMIRDGAAVLRYTYIVCFVLFVWRLQTVGRNWTSGQYLYKCTVPVMCQVFMNGKCPVVGTPLLILATQCCSYSSNHCVSMSSD
jgi:hypothetical protein